MRRLLRAVPALALALVACGAPVAKRSQPENSPAQTLYKVSATVLEDSSHGPSLCNIVATSYPPACGDVPITNWTWSAVDGERRAGKTIWGRYEVVGTYDGARFTLTRPAVVAPESGAPTNPPDFDTPCDEPAGGWTSPDPSRTKDEDRVAALDAAYKASDFAGAWVDGEILNVAFTGNIPAHEKELRRYWGGPLCVARFERTMIELKRIMDDLTKKAEMRFGLKFLSGGPDDAANVVRVTVVLASQDAQRRLDQAYGRGVVVVDSWLQPA